MNNELKEFRCTRNAPYDAPGCAGNEYFTGRQGHYVFAETPMGAALQLISSWPDEMLYGFTMQEKGTDRIFSWTAREGLALYRFGGTPLFGPSPKCGPDEDRPRIAAVCEEEPHMRTLDLPSIIARGKVLYDQDIKTREAIDGFRDLRVRLRGEAEKASRVATEERRRVEREEMLAAAAPDVGPTVEVEGTVDVDVSITKRVTVNVPVELLEEYRKNVQAGPDDDALNQMSDLFEKAAMEGSFDRIEWGQHRGIVQSEDAKQSLLRLIDGWELIEYSNVIAEWKDPKEKEA